MNALGLVLSAALATIASLHLAWAARIWWPVRDENMLARTVVGFRGVAKMPSMSASLAVALALMASLMLAAAISFAPALALLPAWAMASMCGIAGFVFLARGIVGFTPFWADLTPEEPFRSHDRRYYSPLCVALGLGFAVLIWSYLT